METRYESEELDQETVAYLRAAAEYDGQGMPGIYLTPRQAGTHSHTLPWWGAVCGPLIMVLGVLGGFCFGDPVKIALFQTAGLFLGGWMFVAFLRMLVARGRDDYLGHFTYVDPRYIWHATGQSVRVTPIDMLIKADVRHQFDESDNYKSSTVQIDLADGAATLEVRSRGKAEQVEEFLTALLDIRQGSPAERGYLALERVSDLDEDEDEKGDGPERAVTSIPDPQTTRTSLGWVVILLLPVVAGLLFAGCYVLAQPLRDAAAFAAIKGNDPDELRRYLMDKRNTRHRDEVVKRLGVYHDNAAALVLQKSDPFFGPALAEIVKSLRTEGRPIITIAFKKTDQKRPDLPEGHFSPAVLDTMNREIVKRLSTALSQHVGQKVADYAEVTDGPAMIEFAARITMPAADGPMPREVKIAWTVTLQPEGADSKKQSHEMQTSRVLAGTETPLAALRTLYNGADGEFMNRLRTKGK